MSYLHSNGKRVGIIHEHTLNEALWPERCVLQGEETPKQHAQTLRSVLKLLLMLNPSLNTLAFSV